MMCIHLKVCKVLHTCKRLYARVAMPACLVLCIHDVRVRVPVRAHARACVRVCVRANSRLRGNARTQIPRSRQGSPQGAARGSWPTVAVCVRAGYTHAHTLCILSRARSLTRSLTHARTHTHARQVSNDIVERLLKLAHAGKLTAPEDVTKVEHPISDALRYAGVCGPLVLISRSLLTLSLGLF